MFFIKEIIKKILYQLGWDFSIDWSKRVRQMGADSIYDSNTLKKDKDLTTKAQIKLYRDLIDRQLEASKISKVLDYGCGTGRHFELLSSLGSLNKDSLIIGFDPTSELMKFSQEKGYSRVYDEFNPHLRFDLIFCHMVLGGLNDKELKLAFENMVSALNSRGSIILIEAINNSKPRLHTKWKIRNQEHYMPDIGGLQWSIIGETYENNDCLKIFIGKLASP